MSTLITFATEKEAACSLHTLAAIPIDQNRYRYANGEILITGMGPLKTEQSLKNYTADFDKIINIGIAGALKKEIAADSWHAIKSTSHNDANLQLAETGVKLLTLSYPLHDMQERDRHSQHFDLVDMEGHIVARFALQKGRPCQLFKLVSDYCTPNTTEVIMKRLNYFSEMISCFLSTQILK
jgi:nucleoside phosphorylase